MQVANKRVTKFTTKIFNILISFDMRTLKKPSFSHKNLDNGGKLWFSVSFRHNLGTN